MSSLWDLRLTLLFSATDILSLKGQRFTILNKSILAKCFNPENRRILKKEKSDITLKQAAELTHTMYQLNITLPESKKQQTINLKMDELQTQLWNIILKNYQGVPTLKTEKTFHKAGKR